MSIIGLKAHHSPSPKNFYVLLQSSFALSVHVFLLIIFHCFHQSCNTLLMFLLVLNNFLIDVHLFLVGVVLLFYGGLLMLYALPSSLYNLFFLHCKFKFFSFSFANVFVLPYYLWWFLIPCWSVGCGVHHFLLYLKCTRHG
jgi:hypothetical protein